MPNRPSLAAAALGVLAVSAACSGSGARRHVPASDPALPFSNAVLIDDTLYVAGHLGLDPATGRAPEDAEREARLMLDAFAATIAAGGMTMADLVQVQVYCSDVGHYDTFNAVYREYLDSPFPARAFIGSGPLLRGARFEILGIARR